MRMRPFSAGCVLIPFGAAFLFMLACLSLPPPSAVPSRAVAVPQGSATVPADTPDGENIALARQSGKAARFSWEDFSAQAFARAARTGRLVLLDCVATWCHWCHVMDETTYRDSQVGDLLHQRFLTVRVDIDARPDLAARYEAWGWPATVIFSPSGQELGVYRGYLAAAELYQALNAALALQARQGNSAHADAAFTNPLAAPPAPLNALPWIGARVVRDLDSFYDDEAGGWGFRHKMVLGANLEVELLRAAYGDKAAFARAALTFARQRALYDPVWGGIYQYSTGGVWTHPHFEKLLSIQTAGIEALARAYALTHDRAYLDDALRITRYMQEFLQDPSGAFLVSQDADLGGHEGNGRFVDGHVYYAKSANERRALGIPRVDRHIYPYENGLAIAALVRLATAVGPSELSQDLLLRARRAANLMLAQFVDADGTVFRERSARPVPHFLVDAAALGRGLALLGVATANRRYSQAAARIAATLLKKFAKHPAQRVAKKPSAEPFLLWGQTPDASAVGVFAQRQQPFAANVLAARLLASLRQPAQRQRARQILAGLSTTTALAAEGRMLGEYLLALDEVAVLPLRPVSAESFVRKHP